MYKQLQLAPFMCDKSLRQGEALCLVNMRLQTQTNKVRIAAGGYSMGAMFE